ncbi:hypothetical protein [Thalassotalea mangrovi]|uniref:DUF11 domain-containing protein n=1 Tax=Thalassotalea mangrovi TaxID=2572245 RepID=A0A4U1B1E5_9GAMM|nr:hypothetical protein [Thalassotalea mangrovi]TKB43200.1 hypothetical protein E8M12_15715 [Thalassotalea mangrovi]
MADAYLLEPGNSLATDALNCTANDVEITQVGNISITECSPGDVISFDADLTVKTNAKERWDTTFYLPLTDQSPQVVQTDLGAGAPTGVTYPDYCSIALPKSPNPDIGSYVDLDMDQCGDIQKFQNPSPSDSYVLVQQEITMLCIDKDGDNRADFNYCAAWDNQTGDNCTAAADPYPGQIPNTKSKCNCDTFNIDIFIQPDPPEPAKEVTSVSTYSEPGGQFDFSYSFTNTSMTSAVTITSLTDYIDLDGNGTFETAINLWDTPAPAGTADGIYLTASTCAPAMGSEIEVAAGATFSCMFSVTIVDSDLPDDQSPEIYDDTVLVSLLDKNDDPIGDPESCPGDVPTSSGDTCSDVERVTVTNLPPSITVTKTPDKASVLEPGDDVTFTVEVTSTSGTYDDPVTLDSLTDSDFGDLNGKGDCATGGTIFLGAPYTCSFTEFIGGDQGDVHMNTVTAMASDNEGDDATAEGSASVNINDVPSNITLVKTVDGLADGVAAEVEETGDTGLTRSIDYTYRFSVDAAGVDDVNFDKLEDVVDTADAGGSLQDLTDNCFIDLDSDGVVADAPLSSGYTLSPGEFAECTITLEVSGDAGYTWSNLATVYGTDTDGAMLMASDPADVLFIDVPLQITPEFAFKLNVYVKLTNGGVDNVDITAMTVGGVALTDGATPGANTFVIRDESSKGYDYGAETSLPFCSFGANPDILVGETFKCAFTVELQPGFEVGDVMRELIGPQALIINVADDEGSEDIAVGVSVQTIEP